MGILGT